MQSGDINIENLTIDIFVDDPKDANSFLNKSADEIKRFVLPEIERQLFELNIYSSTSRSLKSNDLDLGNLEIDLVSSKADWKNALSGAILKKVVNEVELNAGTIEPIVNGEIKGDASEHVFGATQAAAYVDLFVQFLQTGFISRKKGFAPIAYREIETELLALNPLVVWQRLTPVLSQSKAATARLIRQSSPALWSSLMEAVFPLEVHLFVANWIKWNATSRKQKEEIQSIVIQFILEKRSAGHEALVDFSTWTKEFAVFVARSGREHSIVELIQKMSIPKRAGTQSVPVVVQKQWASFSSELFTLLVDTSLKGKTAISESGQVAKLPGISQIDAEKVDQRRNRMATDEIELFVDEVIIENAGIVLLQPFYPSVFKNLGFLNAKNQWIDEAARVKAIYTLHYVATGEWEASEDQLLIQKLLTGYTLSEVLPVLEAEDILTEELAAQMEELLEVIHDNWKPMRNCTWPGLRNDFLTRSAQLEKMDEMNYKLILEPHILDILLPMKNWGMSLVKYSWMEGVVFVEWGN